MKKVPLLLLPAVALCASAAAQTALVAHYELNETSGTAAADSSGNGNNGTYMGGYVLGQPGICSSSTAVLFNGVDSYVGIPPSASLDTLLSDLTVTAWINQNTEQLHRVFASQRDNCVGSTASWAFGPNGGGNLRFTTLGVQDFIQASTLQAGVWQHIACVFDANFDATFYLDGVLQGTVIGAAPAGPSTLGYFIGLLDLVCFSEYFDGLIDDVQVYSGSATAQEIMGLFMNPCSTIGGGAIGMSYCGPAIPNSTGQPGVISASGSIFAAANDVTLLAEQLPPGQFGYFLAGQTQGFFNPPNSQGIICLAGNIGRYNQIANIIQGPTGGIVIDLGSIPVNPPAAVQSGETWNFQCWFRDNNPTLTSNFTNGVSITFQ